MSEKDSAKKKKNKRAYLNDFQLQENGEYAYKGTVYKYEGDWQDCRKKLRILCAMLGGLTVAAGLVPCGGLMNTFYVILPYIAEVCLGAYLIYNVLRMTAGDGEVREYIFKKSFEAFSGQLLILFICAAMCLLGEILRMILARSVEGIGFSLLFIVLQSLIFGTVAGFNRQCQSMTFEKMKNK
jgi:hypothetical protein